MEAQKPSLAHSYDDENRTYDVQIDNNVTFEQLMLSPHTLAGLKRCNFVHPSPIQLRAIPLGRCGLDLFVQAKSGTGKTLVFAIIALERFDANVAAPQALILVPTREIAVQVQSVLEAVGVSTPGFTVASCIGGIEVENNRRQLAKGARCVVGTPGRVLHLISNQMLNVDEIRLLVLDEADKLMTDSFRGDVEAIIERLTARQQTIVVSATFEQRVETTLARHMKNPLGITPKREVPVLLGITQFTYDIPAVKDAVEEMRAKTEKLIELLTTIEYNQCLVFTNSQSRAESYNNYLRHNGIASEVLTGAQDQETRLRTFDRLKNSPKCKVLVTTDLLSRGIDAERVNLVVNLDVPTEQFLYLHRIGRAGRFGSLGIAITMISSPKEMEKFTRLLCAEMEVFKLTKDQLKGIWSKVKDKEGLEQVMKLNLPEKEKEETVEKLEEPKNLLGIFDMYEKLVAADGEGAAPQQEEADEDPKDSLRNDNIFLQKIAELKLFDKTSEPAPSTKSDKFSTISNKDSHSCTDGLDESELNEPPTVDNLNTVQINEKVNNFLESLDQEEQATSPIDPNLNSDSANRRVVAFLEQNDENGEESGESEREDGEISSKEEGELSSSSEGGDDEESSSSEEDSTASRRGSGSFVNGLDADSESEYEDAVAAPAADPINDVYQRSHTTWRTLYWNQTTQIVDYVKYCRFTRATIGAKF